VSKAFKALPKRIPLEFKYVDANDRKMVSIRLPEPLIAKMKAISEDTGYKFTEIVQYALDQYCQLHGKTKR
jgi:hypothetical protein